MSIFVTHMKSIILKNHYMLKSGTIIKKLREKFGYNQDAVGDYLGIQRGMISYYETGSREAPLEVLEKLADLFGVDLEIFFSEDVEEATTDLAFAFRADELNEKDLESIASFRRVIKNYQRIKNLEKRNA